MRASSVARAIWVAVMSSSIVSRHSLAISDPLAPAMLYHMCASVASLRTPLPLAYMTPRSSQLARISKTYICSTADGREISDEQIEEVKRFIKSGEYDIRNNNAQHLNFIDEGKFNGFCNLFLAKKWRIIISARPCHFITSDNPVAEVIPPRTELTPVTFMDRRHLLALTPDILIETCRPDSMNPEQQPVDRVSYHTANEKGVLMFNKVLVNNAHQFAYAPRTDEFEQLLKAIQLGRK